MSFHKYPYVSTWSTSSPSLLVPGAVKKTSPAHSRSVSSRSISRAVRGARAPAKSQQMSQSLFAHVHAFQSRKVSGLKLAPIATFSSIGRFRLPFLVAVLFMLTHCYPLTSSNARREAEKTCCGRRWFASKCARHDRSRRGRRGLFFFFVSLSLSLPAARRRRR